MDEDSPNLVAVVGMAGRFPGARGVPEFWDLVLEGRDGLSEALDDRPWLRELHSAGRVPTLRGGFLDGIDQFDAGFFELSPRDARRADPQQRLVMEVSYEAVENAGIPAPELSRVRTGVFVGCNASGYWERQIGDLDSLDLHADLGGSVCVISGRVAYALDLHGPAVTVDTACSSSLYSIHMACQALRTGECDMALAGGSNIILNPYRYLSFGQAGALSPDGRCKFGDASANGYARSEAVGMVLLKPLADALSAGDRVRAVIRGGASNSCGFTGQGITVPSVPAQVDMLQAAYRAAGVDPRDVAFVEAHGTGTPIGDPVELTALSQVLGPRAGGREQCLVGSAKTSVGHAEGASGVVGLIKAVLSLENRVFPGNSQLSEPTPAFDWASASLLLPRKPTPLPSGSDPVLAGVNSFGASGTNVHLVLSSAPEPAPRPRIRSGATPQQAGSPCLLPLSARSGAALRALAGRYADLLESPDAPALATLCAAAALRREHHEYRLAVTGRTAGAMASALRAHLQGEERPNVAASVGGCWSEPRIVFVSPGQGSQWFGMGRQLLGWENAFSTTLASCDAVIRTHAGWSLLDALQGDDERWLRQTAKLQPALWAMGVSLAALWRSWGIEPSAVLGHSQGEIASAQLAGALTLAEAGRLSCVRARLIDELAGPGGVCWAECPPDEVPELLRELGARAEIAVEESATSVVLAGEPEEIDRIVAGCEARGISCLPVPVGYAAHSPSVDPVREPLRRALADLAPVETAVPFLSTVTGGALPGTGLDADYWWRNLREPVRLATTVREVLTSADTAVFLQVSPHPLLSGALAREGAAPVESLRRDQDELGAMLGALGKLYAAGCNPDWAAIVSAPNGHVELPGYAWQRSSYWYQDPRFPWPPVGTSPSPEGSAVPTETQTGSSKAALSPPEPQTVQPEHPLLAPFQAQSDLSPGTRTWHAPLDRERHGFLRGHRVSDRPVVPAATYLELTLAASAQHGAPAELLKVDLLSLLLLEDDEPWDTELHLTLEAATGGGRATIESSTAGFPRRTEHATMRTGPAGEPPEAAVSLADLRERCPDWQAGERFYRDHSASGNDWRGAFRCIAELWHGHEESLARLRPVAADGFLIHPGNLDGCLQTLAAVFGSRPGERGFVLLGIETVRLFRPVDNEALWVHARRVPATDPDEMRGDLLVLDHRGAVVAEILGVRGRSLGEPRVPEPHKPPETVAPSRMHDLVWQPLLEQPQRVVPGHWLLLNSDTPLDQALHSALSRAGCTVSTVRAGSRYAVEGPGRYRADLSSTEGLVRVLKDCAREQSPAAIVQLGALGCVTGTDASPREVQWTAADLCMSQMALARALSEVQLADTPHTFILTRGAQQVLDDDSIPAPWQAPLWAFGPALRREVPQCAAVVVDLPQTYVPGEASALARLLMSPGREDRIALRGDRAYVPRLVAADERATEPALALYTDGGIDDVTLRPLAQRPEPGRGEVEVAVSHASLNYHDLLDVVGVLGSPQQGSDDHGGFDFAGTVTRTGPGVRNLAVGDEVFSGVHVSHRSHVLARAACTVRRPAQLTPAEAAAVLGAHGTAYHSLVELARLEAGETVLIHSASGGLGLAAMDIARWRGATVYATAGTKAKRELLLRLGAAKVADSRSTDFARELRDAGVLGVDVVLNTLAGDAAEANFELLSPYGRFVDVAVNNARLGHRLNLALLAPGRAYFHVDMATRSKDEEFTARLLHRLVELFEREELAPPRVQVTPAEQASQAMMLMARAGHVGKVVLKFPSDQTGPSQAPEIRPDATYLVVGGLSGLGGLVADWLVERGARHLLLTGRSTISANSGSTDPRAVRLARLSALPGLQVEYAPVDVADEDAMSALLRRREQHGLPAVAGVVHSALDLEPTPLTDLSEAEVDQVLRPKVAGGWALHRLFHEQELDFFVLFSSAVSLLSGLRLGSQLATYAAANAFLDALARHRRGTGLPATVVNWGYWTETGMAHRLSERAGQSVAPAGTIPIHPEEAPALFDAMLAADTSMCFIPVDWNTYVAAAPQDADAPILRALLGPTPSPQLPNRTQHARDDSPPAPPMPAAAMPHVGAQARKASAIRAEAPTRAVSAVRTPAAATPPATAPEHMTPPRTAAAAVSAQDLEQWLIEQLAVVLDLPTSEIDPTRPVSRLGIDSLMAAELGTRLRRKYDLTVTVPQLLKASSVRALAAALTAGAAAGAL